MSRIRLLVVMACVLAVVSLSACKTNNYKAIGWVDGSAGIQGLAGKVGEETPITQPYVIHGKATVTGQYPEQPHLTFILEPDAIISVQNQQAMYPYGYGAGQCAPAPRAAGVPVGRGTGQALEGGRVVVYRR